VLRTFVRIPAKNTDARSAAAGIDGFWSVARKFQSEQNTLGNRAECREAGVGSSSRRRVPCVIMVCHGRHASLKALGYFTF